MIPLQDYKTEADRQDDMERILRQHRHSPDALIEVLHFAQENYGYLPRELLGHLAEQLKLPPSLVYGVASFYHGFRLEPRGRHHCTVCTGTSCHIKGGSALLAELERRFGISCGETAPDGSFSLDSVRCLGVCDLAPLAVLDDDIISAETIDALADKVCQCLAEKSSTGKSP